MTFGGRCEANPLPATMQMSHGTPGIDVSEPALPDGQPGTLAQLSNRSGVPISLRIASPNR